jgi:hypothetical protein
MSKPGIGRQRKGRAGRWQRRGRLWCALLLAGLTAPLPACSAQSRAARVSQTGYITVSGGIPASRTRQTHRTNDRRGASKTGAMTVETAKDATLRAA